MLNSKIVRTFHALDYVVGVATMGYGIVTRNFFVISLGLAGLALARLNLADKLAHWLQKYLRRKQNLPTQALPEDIAVPVQPAPKNPRPNYGLTKLKVSSGLTFSSRHSLLSSTTHFTHTL